MAPPKKYTTKNGEVRYEVRYRNLDNRSTRQRGFRTLTDANNWARDNATRLATGTHIPASAQRKLAGPFVETYINRTASIRPTTAASRTSTARTWVLPAWANRPVGRIDQEGVQAWVEELHQQGVSAATIEKAVGVLRGSLALAVKSKALSLNPVVEIELPEQVRRDNAYLTAEQVAHLVSRAGRQALLVSFLASTGLRFGEAAALRVQDLDLDAGRVRIRASVTEVNGKLVEGPPKNGKARSVPLAHFLRAPLASSIQGRSSDSLVFRAARGGPLRANTWRSRDFATAVRAAQEAAPSDKPFPTLVPHDLRHTAASLAVQAGANVKVLQRMLGHAKASMTLDVYADLFDSDLDDVVAALAPGAQASGIAALLRPAANGELLTPRAPGKS